MNVKIKKLHPNAVVPKYAKPGDAGMDLYTTKDGYADKYGNMVYHTGLAMEIPKNHVGLLLSRTLLPAEVLSESWTKLPIGKLTACMRQRSHFLMIIVLKWEVSR